MQVLPPYTDKLSDYFASPGKIVSVITTTGQSITDDYLYYLYGSIESTDNARIRIGTNPRITLHPRYMRRAPGAGFAPYTLKYDELQQIFSEQTLLYQGITREQVQRNGLPPGSYRICFRLFIKAGWMNQFEEVGKSCSAPFQIRKKEAIVNQTVQVLPPYTNKLSDYFQSPGKIQSIITVTQYPDNQAFFDVTGTLEQVGGNVRIGSGQFKTFVRINGTQSGNNVIFSPYILTHTNYTEMFQEPMVYQGITREQVQRDGLPEGNYRLCFKLRNAQTGKEIGTYCSAPFQIRKKEAIVNQTVQVLPPYTNKLSDYFQSPGKIQSIITVTQYPDNQAFFDVTGTLEQVGGGIRIGSGQFKTSVRINGTPSGNNVIFSPYTLTHTNYTEMFRDPMVYQGITREQVLRDGLPEGSYRLCFKLRNARAGKEIGTYCSAPFQIRKKDAIVNQAVMVMPPYTNKLSDYFETPGKIRDVITITQYPDNNASLRVQGTLESTDGKIAIGSAQHAASVQIKGTSSGNQTIFTPYTLTHNDLRDIFKEPINYQGITREQVLRDGLPEGSYRLCFKVYDAKRNQLLSQMCSPPFMVAPPMLSALEPPQLIQPYDGSELPPEQKQTVQFTWTMPPGAPATTQYMIKIIELNDRYANYRDMLRNSSYPAFFETTVRGVPTYLYTPANPAFKEDKMYAWVVRAIGDNVSMQTAIVPGTTFKNDGYSEPAVFTFKKNKLVKVEPPKEKKPKEIVSEEGLKIFVPGCRNCKGNNDDLTNDIPEVGSTYQLQGHTLNPNLLSGPNANADPKGRKLSNGDVKADLGSTSLASGSGTKIEIPADAIAVNNARNFYLRWEDKSSLLAKRQPKPGEGIIYHLQIREAKTEKLVWEKDVWNHSSYEQTKKGLPFVDGQKYRLHIAAMRGVVTPNGFAAVIDAKGKPDVLASSCQCEFTYMKLKDVPNLVEYTVKGKLSYFFEHDPEIFPLTTTTATLTRYTRLIDAKTKKPVPIYSKMSTPNDDRHSVPIKIKDDGTFEVTIYAYPDGGLIEEDQRIRLGEFAARGDLYEFFNLELNSPYYKPLDKEGKRPSKTEVNLSDRTIDLGEISFNVWSYTLEIEMSRGYSEKKGATEAQGFHRNQDMTGLRGDVKRATEKTGDIPRYEGDMHLGSPSDKKLAASAVRNDKGFSATIDQKEAPIARGKVSVVTDKNGKKRTIITFDRLICNFQSNDEYLFNILQETEVGGKKKTLYANGFNKEAFRYIPNMKELNEKMKTGQSRFVVKRKAVLIDDTPPRSTVKGRLVFKDPCDNESKERAFANTDVALVLTYLLEDGKGHSTVMNVEELLKDHGRNGAITITKPEYFPGEHVRKYLLDSLENRSKVLAVARTDANGNFEFKDFVRIDSTFTEAYKDDTGTSGDIVSCTVKLNGTLRATVRLVINSPKRHWWRNPSKNIDIQPNSSMDVGTLLALQNTYLLKIKPIGDPHDKTIDYPGQQLNGAVVKVTRDEMYNGEGAGGIVVKEKTAEPKEDGCVFSVPKHRWQLIPRNDGTMREEEVNELLIAVSTSDSTGEHSFYPDRIRYPKDYIGREVKRRSEKARETGVITIEKGCEGVYESSYGDYLFTTGFKKETCECPITLEAKRPIISGRVLDSENTKRSVEDGEVRLRYSYKKHVEEYVYVRKGRIGQPMTPYEEISEGLLLTRSVSEAKGHGYFQFDNLIPNYDYEEKKNVWDQEKKNIIAKSEIRWVSASQYQLSVIAKGYRLELFEQKGKGKTNINGNSLWFPAEPMKPKMGQQLYFPQILMKPSGTITGYVVDEEGHPQEAIVFTTRSMEHRTSGGKEFGGSNRFSVPAPSGYTDTLFVQPVNRAYFTDTILIPEMPEGKYDVGKVVVMERKHRIRIVVHPKKQGEHSASTRSGQSINGKYIGKQSGLSGITVRIDAPGVKEQVTNDKGVVEFKFKNASNGNFHYELIPPENSDYIASSGELTNHESKHIVEYNYWMRKGATVSGRVTSDGKPVPEAKIWVMNGDNKREVTADADGRYTLRGIKAIGDQANSSAQTLASSSKNVRKTQNESRLPSGGKYYATIHCGAPKEKEEYANLLGKDTEASFADIDGKATVDFDLDIFYKANISTLHGFKVTVTDVKEDGGDNYRISGSIQLDKVPGRFGKRDRMDQNPAFKDLKVRINHSEKDTKGRPYFEVPGEGFSIGMKLMNVDLKGTEHSYRVLLANAGDAFLNISKEGLTGGFIRSKAQIEPASFSFSSTNFTFENDQFYLSEAGDGRSNGQVTSFKSYVSEEKMNAWKTETEKGREYLIHNADFRPVAFKFVEFDATSPINRSRLGTDGVIRLKPDVWFINPLFKPFNKIDTIRLDLPEVKITPSDVEGDVKLDKIDVKFEKWTIEVRNCKVDATKGGISSNDFVVRTGKIDLRGNDFLLNKDMFRLDGFAMDKIPLGKDVANIDIESGKIQFGADSMCGRDLKPHLKLSVVGKPAGSIKGLPGFAHPLVFQMISLLSSGEDILSFAPDCEKMRLHDVVDFLPYTINSYEDAFSLDGAIDYGIPRIPTNINHKLLYTKKSGKLNLEIKTSDISFTNVGTFKSLKSRKDLQLITPGLAELHGTIEEPGALDPLQVVVRKQRTSPGNYRIWMELEDQKQPRQSICLGGGRPGSGDAEFRVERADMVILPEKNDWDFLRLKLVPSDAYGNKSGFGTAPLYFALAGELRTDTEVDPQKQQIKMVGTDRNPQQEGVPQDGFVGFKFVYDHPRQELTGNMHIQEKNVGGTKFSGDLAMAVGRYGFYFAGGGEFQSSPFGRVACGMIFGSYDRPVPSQVWEQVLSRSKRKELPCDFTGGQLRGFYAMGAMDVPLTSINYSFDAGIASGGVRFHAGVEGAVWGSFLPGNEKIGVSGMLYLDAEAYLHAITCTSVDARLTATVKGESTLAFRSPYTARLNVCGDLNFSFCVMQKIPTVFFGCVKPPLIPYKVYYNEAVHAGFSAAIDLKDPLHSLRIENATVGMGRCKSPGFCTPVKSEKRGACD
ncbi:hypothetical protein BHU09_02395 [Tannerella sp. oral taxon 808]|nr:hypothetical protein BHU09_02395 [Tannerella sp. oral taxon 808]